MEVSVELCPGCRSPQVLEARVTLAPSQAASDAKPLSRTIRVPGMTRLDVPAGQTWEASATAAGYWSQPRIAAIPASGEGPGQAARLELWPAGTVEGELRGAPGVPWPESLTVRFQPAPGASEKLPRASVLCPVAERRFRCQLPAGDLDLRVRARGFITQYRWGARIPADGLLAVGAIELKRGASIVGWVEVPARERLEECRVEIAPQAAGSAAPLEDEERRGWLGQQAKVNSRGFFELSGVTPGSYRLTVRHPRLSPAMVGPIGVFHQSETELDPIELHPPADLEVRLQPASDPYGIAWTGILLREGPAPGSADEVARSVASEEGTWRASGLSPGHYTLQVEGSHNARWLYQPVEVTHGMAPVEVELPVVQVEGEVRLGKEPLEALIWFGGQYGARRIAARSDDEGRFSVVLPQQKDTWNVEVYNEPRAITARFFEMAIRKTAGQRVARVRFEVPDTVVKGRVVDEADRPVSGASVDAFGSAGALDHAKTRSSGEKGSEAGRFELRGLAPGTWQLVADAGGGDAGLSSDALRVGVAEDRPSEEIRLVLRRRIALTGHVAGPSGQPIAGAEVVAFPELASGPYVGWQPHATTDSAGNFTLRLPGSATAVEITLLAPGFAVRQLRVDPRRSEPLVLAVEQVAGTLVLIYPEQHEEGEYSPIVRRLLTTVFHDYRIPADLANWAHLHGVAQTDSERFVIPLLEPGRYTACRLPQDPPPGVDEAAAALAGSCASGELSPNGELLLRLPKPKAPAKRLEGAGSP